jgi:hypothetical protein
MARCRRRTGADSDQPFDRMAAAKSWTVAKHTWLPLGFREESGSAPVELGETCLEVTDDRAQSARGEEPGPRGPEEF